MSVSDSEADVAAAVVAAASDGRVTLASVTRSLAQAVRLHEQFEQRWEFVRNRTLGANAKVRVCACVSVV